MDEHTTKSMATLPLEAERPPLRADEGGVVRVGVTRVALDLVVSEYLNGMTPEDIVRAYDTLELADVYAVIAYYLRHRDEVNEYMKTRDAAALLLRAAIESRPGRPTREALLERRAEKGRAEAG